MKRKILMMLMTFTMSAAMLAGCSKDDTNTSKKDDISTEDTKGDENDNDTSADTSSSEKTLSDYIAEPGVKEQLDSSMESAKTANGNTYEDISWEVNGNTFVYIYVFKDPVSVDEAQKESLDAELSKLVKEQDLINIMEQQSGVKGISVQYIYRNPDGTEVFNGTYSE